MRTHLTITSFSRMAVISFSLLGGMLLYKNNEHLCMYIIKIDKYSEVCGYSLVVERPIINTRDATTLQYVYRYIAISIAAIQYNTPDKNINILQHLLPSKLIITLQK